MEVRKHALLSASASHRWLSCTASARVEEKLPDRTSSYASEGTMAHAVAETILKGEPLTDEQQEFYTVNKEALDFYLDFANSIKNATHTGLISVEHRVNFSKYAPEGFGTVDLLAIHSQTLYVIDLKFGRGIRVDAPKNPQLALYGLGALEDFKQRHEIRKVSMVIVQPRLNHISEWLSDVEELERIGEGMRPKAIEAYAGPELGAQFNPGDWCRFCKASAHCEALANRVQIAVTSEKTTGLIDYSPDELKKAYEFSSVAKNWADSIQSLALEKAKEGDILPGYKLVEGRGTRVWADEKEATKQLKATGLKLADLREVKFKSVATVEKLIGKSAFKQKHSGLVAYNKGALKLAPADDPRESAEPFSEFNDGFKI